MNVLREAGSFKGLHLVTSCVAAHKAGLGIHIFIYFLFSVLSIDPGAWLMSSPWNVPKRALVEGLGILVPQLTRDRVF